LAARHDGVVRIAGHARPVRLDRHLRLGGGRLDPTLLVETSLTNTSDIDFDAVLAIEWNVMLLGGGANPAAWYELDGRRIPHDSSSAMTSCRGLRSGNDDVGVVIDTRLDPPAAVSLAPIETVSNSEAGFELVYQGSTMVLAWPVALAAGQTCSVVVDHHVTVRRDASS
jgi:alpha-amylase